MRHVLPSGGPLVIHRGRENSRVDPSLTALATHGPPTALDRMSCGDGHRAAAPDATHGSYPCVDVSSDSRSVHPERPIRRRCPEVPRSDPDSSTTSPGGAGLSVHRLAPCRSGSGAQSTSGAADVFHGLADLLRIVIFHRVHGGRRWPEVVGARAIAVSMSRLGCERAGRPGRSASAGTRTTRFTGFRPCSPGLSTSSIARYASNSPPPQPPPRPRPRPRHAIAHGTGPTSTSRRPHTKFRAHLHHLPV
jgi:hypothetical protein